MSRFLLRTLMMPVLALVLAGCGNTIYAALDDKGFVRDSAEIVEAADWENAEIFEIDIRQNEFRPTLIHLFRGEPYIMVVENRDDIPHIFAAPAFFRTVAVRKLLTETEEITGSNFLALKLEPGEIKELHFVPVRDGWYEFEDGAGPGIFANNLFFSPLSRGVTLGSVGAFIVEE